MPEYKLTYLNLRGRAEVIRYLFALAGMPYEDIRIEREDWASKKHSTLFGQLPLLSIDGVEYCQSLSISRYLAEKFGLAGKTELDTLRVSMIAHCIEDMGSNFDKVFWERDEGKKEVMRNKVKEEFKNQMAYFDNILKQNNEGDGFFVGDSVTWADVMFFHVVPYAKFLSGIEFEPLLGPFPKLKALMERVEKIPQIADWRAKRPQNPY